MCAFTAASSEREAQALQNAQILIEEQRDRIEALTETVLQLQQQQQHQQGEVQALLQGEVKKYIIENQRLRLGIDSLKAEVAALCSSRQREDNETQQLVEALAAAEKGIAERDRLIQTLQVKVRV